MKEFWNERYRQTAYAYGEAPNAYFKEQLRKLKPGKILLPAEGEGRNAIFAAKLGWDVFAFDLSEQGKFKALRLAQKNKVEINYQVGTPDEIFFEENSFDAIGLIYAHFPATVQTAYHQRLAEYLKQGGIVILEAFSKQHIVFQKINPSAGGPKNIAMLFSAEVIKRDFPNFQPIELVEQETRLTEGTGHVGKASVIRFLGKKILPTNQVR